MNRRDFLMTSGIVALGSALPAAAIQLEKKISSPSKLPTREFGKTGHTLPIFGHGGSAMIEQENKHYGVVPVPTMEERIAMVRYGYDQGIRYFDTARIYGESESIMGKALKDVRHDVFLATKVLVFDPEKVRPSVEKSLEELETDYVDSMQLHGPVIERHGFEGCMKIHEELVKLREEGLVRFIGLTGHNQYQEMHKLIATGGFDTLLMQLGYFNKGYNTRHSNSQIEWRNNCTAKASELGMGIVAMKVMSANVFSRNSQNILPSYDPAQREKLPAAAIRYVLNDPRIHILNIGISIQEDIDRNIAIFTGDTTYSAEDRMLLADYSAQAYLSETVQGLELV